MQLEIKELFNALLQYNKILNYFKQLNNKINILNIQLPFELPQLKVLAHP